MMFQRFILLFSILVIYIGIGDLLSAEEERATVSYDLTVTIEPVAGTIAVRGKIDVPVAAGSKTLQFGLHETFAITRITVNGRPATFSFHPAERSPIFPATKSVIVTLPAGTQVGNISMGIEYGGKLKQLPEFGAAPSGELAMDDQITSRMVDLATYSSWYPLFGVFGHPIQIALELSLPKGWTSICSGKKLGESAEDGRTVTRWVSAKDTDILITAAPTYKREIISSPG